jgi:hypothetical protein
MVSVTSGLTQSAWQLLHDTISGMIIDPESRSKKFIFPSFPQSRASNFPGYPIITIDSFDTTSRKRSFSERVYAMDTSVALYGTKWKKLEELTGSVIRVLEDRSTVLHASGLTNMVITSSSTGPEVINGKKVHVKLMGLDFDVVNV